MVYMKQTFLYSNLKQFIVTLQINTSGEFESERASLLTFFNFTDKSAIYIEQFSCTTHAKHKGPVMRYM